MSIRTYFENIADAIREKSGSSDTYTPAEMPQAIRDIIIETHTFRITVIGGYNGGAMISVRYDSIIKFSATGSTPYNLQYSPSGGSFTDVNGNTVTITITPPVNQNGKLYIELSGGISYSTGEILPNGSNTSYGYNFDTGDIDI